MAEVAMALLGAEGFEAFEETEADLLAYAQESLISAENLASILTQLGLDADAISPEVIPPHNWNASWEENFPVVEIGSFCQIIASFKKASPDFKHTIRIDPKMSFGTGHHETTRLVVRQMESLDFLHKNVLDMGCGTGVLGILAAKLGAAQVLGIDIDPWSYENVAENSSLNGVENMETLLGDVSVIPDVMYDVILANINRNVLLRDVSAYSRHLKPGGILVSSGYYRSDGELIETTFGQANLNLQKTMEENAWLSQLYVKE
jgi:ribosomal protein L11 methyltransferase